MTNHIVYVHGANATPKSFSYLEGTLPAHTKSYITYDASDSLAVTIRDAAAQIDQPCHIIGHSLGGVIALAISQLHGPSTVRTVTTISAPFGGSETAERMSIFMPFNPFLKNIKSSNTLLKNIAKVGPTVPTMTIITTGGRSPLEPKDNDGVVTVESQLALARAYQVHVPYTHFEVLMDQGVADMINLFMATSPG